MTMKKPVLLLCIATLLMAAGCKDKVKPGSVEVKRPVVTGATLAKIPLSQIDAYYETSGTVKARTTSVVAGRIMGMVTAVKVKEGDQVKAGDLLITIDDRDLAERSAAAEAGYREALSALEAAKQNKSLAEVTYGRYKNLHQEKVISGQEMDQIETQKKVADSEYERANEAVKRTKAAFEEARVYRGFANVTAPVSGLVSTKKIDHGSMAVPGAPLLVIEDTSRLKVEASIDESLSGRFKPGMVAYLALGGGSEKIRATVGEIVPAVDPASRTFTIRIYVQDASLKTGSYVKVLLPAGKKDALLVPKKAVVERGQLTGIYVVDDQGIMTFRLIKSGSTYGEKIEVLSGLQDGEKIVVEGVEKAVDGGIVRQ